jgi:predicted signal transduction protein with EAL and GGDEF domain
MLLRAVLCSLILGGAFAPAHALTQEELLTRLEAAGYSQIRENGAGKIKTFKAVKDGREVRVVVDSLGHVKELQ